MYINWQLPQGPRNLYSVHYVTREPNHPHWICQGREALETTQRASTKTLESSTVCHAPPVFWRPTFIPLTWKASGVIRSWFIITTPGLYWGMYSFLRLSCLIECWSPSLKMVCNLPLHAPLASSCKRYSTSYRFQMSFHRTGRVPKLSAVQSDRAEWGWRISGYSGLGKSKALRNPRQENRFYTPSREMFWPLPFPISKRTIR